MEEIGKDVCNLNLVISFFFFLKRKELRFDFVNRLAWLQRASAYWIWEQLRIWIKSENNNFLIFHPVNFHGWMGWGVLYNSGSKPNFGGIGRKEGRWFSIKNGLSACLLAVVRRPLNSGKKDGRTFVWIKETRWWDGKKTVTDWIEKESLGKRMMLGKELERVNYSLPNFSVLESDAYQTTECEQQQQNKTQLFDSIFHQTESVQAVHK